MVKNGKTLIECPSCGMYRYRGEDCKRCSVKAEGTVEVNLSNRDIAVISLALDKLAQKMKKDLKTPAFSLIDTSPFQEASEYTSRLKNTFKRLAQRHPHTPKPYGE